MDINRFRYETGRYYLKIICGQNVIDWVSDRLDRKFVSAVGIGIQKSGELIGGIVFDNFTGASMHIHVASNGSKKWITKDLLWYTFHYAFNVVGVKKLIGIVNETNELARRFDENLGFKLEARIEGIFVDGDCLIYGMRQEDCRFLTRGHIENLHKNSLAVDT